MFVSTYSTDDKWVRIKMKTRAWNPTVTFYASNGNTAEFDHRLRVYISSNATLSTASHCGDFADVQNGDTDVTTCVGEGQYLWVRGPAGITKPYNVRFPEIVIH
eukprot:g5903.t1